MNIFEDKTIVAFGGTGSWGRELTKQLLECKPRKVIIFSRGEIMQVDMQRKFNDPRLEFVIGDVRSRESVDNAMRRGVDYVFHLAALKHVPVCENQPQEAIETNIIGTKNVINSAIIHGVKKFIDVSTDKAVSPINTYGFTKGVGERLTIQANCLTRNTEFICIRGGNVLGTNGSLVPYVIEQIRSHNRVQITDSKMTRFFLTLPQAIKLLFWATEQGVGGETYVMNMPSFYIRDLVELLVSFYGNKNTSIVETGAREGEKTHELLISGEEGQRTRIASKEYYVIYPQLITGRNHHHQWDTDAHWDEATGLLNIFGRELSSADNIRDKAFLTELLKQGGWMR